ncbi:hypothetical protein L596_018049 [Steinernema carpocapsae]|uniref:Sister chromatid cohesion protein n=1 Tax=Steinernema carpocapsae TaxID=34508 RepID=A0A4V6A1X3_STECR|nr:hypothetical protein L596_018049 [Steinernema carpocapsae]
MPPKKARNTDADCDYYPGKCKPIVDDLPPAEELRRIQDLSRFLKTIEGTVPQNQRGDYCSLFTHITRSDLLKRCAQSAEAAVSLGCSIADLLRVLVEHPPTLDQQRMLEALLFTVSGLKALDVSGPIYQEALYLLENLVKVESLKLAFKLETGSQQVLRKLIVTSLNVFKTRDEVLLGHPPDPDIDAKHVQRLMLIQIQNLIVAAEEISNEVLDALFFFIIEPQKSQSRVSYRMAAEIIKQSVTNIEPWLVPFLSQAILTQEMPECRMTGTKRLDSIVFSLYEIVPDTILTILPQMEMGLKAAKCEHRLSATKLLGNIFKLPDVNAADQVPQLWNVFLERSKDVEVSVRIQCLELLPTIFMEHQSVRGAISAALSRRADDEVEEVRLAAVRGIFEILRARIDLATDAMLRQVRNHVHHREKKQAVRHECLTGLSKLFSGMHTSGKCTASDLSTIAETMEGVFKFVNITDKEDRIALEKAFILNIVPYKVPVDVRTTMLLDLFVNLSDEVSMKTFTTLITMQTRRMRVVRTMYEAVRVATEEREAEDKDAEVLKKEAETLIRQIAESESDPGALANGMHKFGTFIEKEPRVYNAIKEILRGDYQTEAVEKQMMEIRRMLGSPETGMNEAEMRAVRTFLERAVPLQFDNKVAVELSFRVQRMIRAATCNDNSALANSKPYLALWRMMADYYPQCFLHDEVAKVVSNLLENDNSVVMEHALAIIISASRVRGSQQYLSQVFDELVIERIEHITKQGPPKAAKYAARCLCRILGKDRTSEVFKEMKEELIQHVDASDPLCETSLQTLAVMLHAFPRDYVHEIRDMINDQLYQKVILAETIPEKTNGYAAELDFDERREKRGVQKPKEIRAQIMAFKFLYRYHKTLQTSRDSTLGRTVELFVETLAKKGQSLFAEIGEEHAEVLMFYAANYLLKMGQYPVYTKAVVIPEVLFSMAPLIYDVSECFRNLFFHRFQPLVSKCQVPVEFMALYGLAPLVKNDQEYVNNMSSNFKTALITRQRHLAKNRNARPEDASEYAVAYFINLISYMTEFKDAKDVAALKQYKKCLWSLIGPINEKRETCCKPVLVKHLLEKLKTSECAWCPSAPDQNRTQKKQFNEKMWALADVGLFLLYHKAKLTNGTTFRDKISLSSQFFKPSQSSQNANKSYIPDEVRDYDVETIPSTSTVRANSEGPTFKSPSPALNGSKKGAGLARYLSSERQDSSNEVSTSKRRAAPKAKVKEEPKDDEKPKRAKRGQVPAKPAAKLPRPSRAAKKAGAEADEEEEEPKTSAEANDFVRPMTRRKRPIQDDSPEVSPSKRKAAPKALANIKEEPKDEGKPKRTLRRAAATTSKPPVAKPTRLSRAAKKREEELEEEEEEKAKPSKAEESEEAVRSSSRVRRKRPIFDSSPDVSPSKGKATPKINRVQLESRFGALSPITPRGPPTISKSATGTVTSTPFIKAAPKGRVKKEAEKPEKTEKPAARPTRQSIRKKK